MGESMVSEPDDRQQKRLEDSRWYSKPGGVVEWLGRNARGNHLRMV